jgi:hypothetical protein
MLGVFLKKIQTGLSQEEIDIMYFRDTVNYRIDFTQWLNFHFSALHLAMPAAAFSNWCLNGQEQF